MPSYRPLQSVTRSLEVLRLLNLRPLTSLASLHGDSGLPKPTLVRILETLEHEGYVLRDPSGGGYRVTSGVRSLSGGFHEPSLVVERGMPKARALTEKIRWPLAIGLFDRDAMVVRYSTIPDSPLALFPSTVNWRLPMLGSGMGLAYLAFCPVEERRIILKALRRSDLPQDAVARDSARANRLFVRTRQRGYGLRAPTRPGSGDSASISIPICRPGRVLACLSLTYMARVMTPAAAARRHLPDLRALVDEVAGLESHRPGP
ncbi:MAG: helix-turn-helix domain-containing protein [bacterium]|nr:helix-turn-helix domain-containing protein [bacterium]MCP5065554.1 helix-turn-helix domain-containing protein [bacterium]